MVRLTVPMGFLLGLMHALAWASRDRLGAGVGVAGLRLLFPRGTAFSIVLEHVVAYCRDTPFWYAVFKTEYQLVTVCPSRVVVCVANISIDRVLPQHSRVGKWLEEGSGYLYEI